MSDTTDGFINDMYVSNLDNIKSHVALLDAKGIPAYVKSAHPVSHQLSLFTQGVVFAMVHNKHCHICPVQFKFTMPKKVKIVYFFRNQ